MKFKRLATFLTASLMLGGVLGFVLHNGNKPIEVKAATDINDYSACETAHNNGNASSLFSALQTITAPGKAGSYDGLYTTYKSAYLRNDGKIFDYYSKITNYNPDKDRAGSYKAEGDCFNREHSIPKSWWGGSTSNQGADPFIVVPTDGYVNNRRSAYPFGMVSSATYSASGNFAKLGSAVSSWGYSGTVFEPDDSLKGDFARIYFYAIVKYSAYGWTGNGGSTCFSGSTSTNFGLTNYSVKLFSYWHNLDPVDAWELHANDAIAGIQGNRNPFIDHPEYTDTLFKNNSGYTPYNHGAPSSDSISISKTSASLTVDESTTITATPSDSSVSVSWTNSNSSVASISSTSGKTITVTGVSEGTATITASATINDILYSQNCTVTVTSSGGSGGDDPIPVEGDVTLSINFTSNNSTDTDELGNVWSATGTYTVGSYLRMSSNETYVSNSPALSVDPTQGMAVTARLRTYGGGANQALKITAYNTDGDAISETLSLAPSSSSLANYNGNLTFTSTSYTSVIIKAQAYLPNNSLGLGGLTFEYTAASSKTLTGITVSNPVVVYTQGDAFVKPTVTAHYDDSSSADVTNSATFTGYNMSTIGNQTVTVTYNTESTSYTINVYAPVAVTSLSVSGYEDTFTEGDTFIFGGTVTATFSDSTTDEVEDDCTFTGYNMTTIGNQTVTVSYSNQSTTYGITVNQGIMSSISVTGQKTAFTVGDTFIFDGEVDAIMANGYEKDVGPTSVTTPDLSTVGTKPVTVTVTYNGVTKSTTYNVVVTDYVDPYTHTGTSPYINGLPYKMFFNSTNDSKTYYFTGAMSGYYGATTNTYSGGVDVYFEEHGSGQNLYFYDTNSVKQYIYIALSGTHINFVFTNSEQNPWYYDESDARIYYTISGTDYSIGTSGTYKTFSAALYSERSTKLAYKTQFVLTETGFAKLFLGKLVCDAMGGAKPAFRDDYSWPSFSSIYSGLTTEAKNSLKNASANVSGTDIEQFAAKYDYILGKYGTSQYTNFVARSVSSNGINSLEFNTNTSTILLLAIGYSIIAMTALVLLKKKKQK